MTAPSAVSVDVAAMATMTATIVIKGKSRRIAFLLLGVAPTPCGFGGAPTRRPFARPQGSMTLPLCINRVKFDANRTASDAGALPAVGGSHVLGRTKEDARRRVRLDGQTGKRYSECSKCDTARLVH